MGARKGPRPRFQCLLCKEITTIRNTHLERYHDDLIDPYKIRSMEGTNEEIEAFYVNYFKPLPIDTPLQKINRNPGIIK